jgi:hypothetical protein
LTLRIAHMTTCFERNRESGKEFNGGRSAEGRK